MRKKSSISIGIVLLLLTISLQPSFAAPESVNQKSPNNAPTPSQPVQSQRPPQSQNPTPTPVVYPGGTAQQPEVTPTPTPISSETRPTPPPKSDTNSDNTPRNSQGSTNQDNASSAHSSDSTDSQQGVLMLTIEVPDNAIAKPYTPPIDQETVEVPKPVKQEVAVSSKVQDTMKPPLNGLFLFAKSQDYYPSQKLSSSQTHMLLAVALFFVLNGILLIKPRVIWKHFMTIAPLKQTGDDQPIKIFAEDMQPLQGVKGGKSEHVIFYPMKGL